MKLFKFNIKNISIFMTIILVFIFSLKFYLLNEKLNSQRNIINNNLTELSYIEDTLDNLLESTLTTNKVILKSIILNSHKILMSSAVHLKKIHKSLKELEINELLSSEKKHIKRTKSIILKHQAKILNLTSFLVTKRGDPEDYIKQIFSGELEKAVKTLEVKIDQKAKRYFN